jgi:hypothetical protein
MCAFLAYYGVRTNIPDSGDVNAVSLQAFNLFINGSLAFDQLPGTFLASFIGAGGFSVAPNGHYVNAYPVGMALLTLPLYVIFYFYMKVRGISTDYSGIEMAIWRIKCAHFAAMSVAAGAAAFIYAASCKIASKRRALIVTAAFAFGTTQWVISAQTMWQHGGVTFLLSVLIYCLISALRTTDERTIRRFLVWAGLVAGFFPMMRPTSTIFMAASGCFVLMHFRKRAWPFIAAGSVGLLFLFAYNFWLTGRISFMGQYAAQTGLYTFTLYDFVHAVPGLIVSPSKGLLIYSPFILFCIPAAGYFWKTRLNPESKFMGLMLLASVGLLLNYALLRRWHGDAAYGPRFLTDALPVFCFSLNYVPLGRWLGVGSENTSSVKTSVARSVVFLACLVWAILIELTCVVAGSAGHEWAKVPNTMIGDAGFASRYWDLMDSQVVRMAKSIYYRNALPPVTECSVTVKGFVRGDGSVTPSYIINASEASHKGIQILLGNDGQETLLGYKSGVYFGQLEVAYTLESGESAVDTTETRFYLVDNLPSQQDGIALLLDPRLLPKGRYRLGLRPVLNRGNYCKTSGGEDAVLQLEIK